MTEFALNDEQRQAAEQLSGRVMISAGAGSGKTRVLTERVANAVVGLPQQGWTGIGIDEVLAITFTDKAAGELAERVRGALRAAGRTEEARRVDAAWISTIHGMCARILRAGALEAGIDPGFSVLENVQAETLKQQAFEEVAREALAADPQSSRPFALYGFESVAAACMQLADALRVAGLRAEELEVADIAPVHGLLSQAAGFFSRKADALASEDGEAAVAHCTSCLTTAEGLRRLADDGLSEGELAEALWRALDAHALGNRSAGIKEHVAEIRSERKDLASRAAALVVADALTPLLRLTDAFLDRWAELKRARGGLDFDDLQLETLAFLKSSDADEWSQKFGLTMVDEFQDTDALQLGLVEQLSGENLCTVGDERQSIYGFRGADVSVYRGHRESMRAHDSADITLRLNYRSHHQLLRFVNRVFDAPVMFDGDLVHLAHGRTEPTPPLVEESTSRVEVLFADRDDSPRSSLADAIARRFARLNRDQGIPASDMVILLRTYGHADAYAAALEAQGLDAVIVGGNRFFDEPEVAAVRGLTRIIANSRDEEALGHVLCSDLCGLSDDGLLSLRRAVTERAAVGLWDALSVAELSEPDRLRADSLAAAVENARRRLGRRSLAEVILRAVEETGMDARLLASGLQGGQAYANLLKFVRMAADFERLGQGGAAAFAAHLDSKEAFGDHEPPAPLVRDGSDAVQIMSIHASKGLEFPVVAVPELDARTRGDRSIALWDLKRKIISAALPGSWSSNDDGRRPPAFRAMRDAAKERDLAETKRLLYVAFTRAEDLLIVAGGAALKEGAKDTSSLRLVFDALGVQPRAGLDIRLGSDESLVCRIVDVGSEQMSAADAATEAHAASEAEQMTWLRAIATGAEVATEAAPSAPGRFSYSGLSSFADCPRRYHFERRLGLGARLPTGPTATDFGSAFHAVIEVFGEDEPLDHKRVSAIARFHGLDAAGTTRLVEVIESYRRSPTADQVRGFESVRREAAFAVRVGGQDGFLLDGSIDVYAADEDSALIVDYKTGKTDLTAEEARRAYELQASCYALAAVRDGHSRVEVVFARPEVETEPVRFAYTSEDASATEEKLLALYGRIVAGEAAAAHEAGSAACRGCPAEVTCPH